MDKNIAALNTRVNSLAKFSNAYDLIMDRRMLLQALINEKFGGKQNAFAQAIKRSPAQVNQLLTGYRPVGDGIAWHIEQQLGIAGYFSGTEPANSDGPDMCVGDQATEYHHSAPTPAFSTQELATLCAQIPASKIDLTHAILSAIIDDAAQAIDPISGARPAPTDPDTATESLLRNDTVE